MSRFLRRPMVNDTITPAKIPNRLLRLPGEWKRDFGLVANGRVFVHRENERLTLLVSDLESRDYKDYLFDEDNFKKVHDDVEFLGGYPFEFTRMDIEMRLRKNFYVGILDVSTKFYVINRNMDRARNKFNKSEVYTCWAVRIW